MSVRSAGASQETPAIARGGVRAFAFWAATVVVLLELVSGAVWNLMTIEWVEVQLEHLGYPDYFAQILGVAHVAAAVVIAAPGFPLVKEWAYAGVVLMWTGAVASHLALGDGLQSWGPPLMFAVLAVVSWTLRPADRRVGRDRRPETRPRTWAVPVALLAAMCAFAFLTLPVVEDFMHDNAVELGWIEE